jgi:histone-lysine N-methyltransferase SETMAR
MSGESSTVLKIEYRAVIKYLVKKGKKAKEIFEDLAETYLNFSPSCATVKRWTRLFQQGRESIEDDPHPGRPQTVVTEENVKKVENLILQDRRIRVRQIADELKISTERIHEIIHNYLHMSKVCARWVPKMLTPFDKQRRVQCSRQFLDLSANDFHGILHRIITVDETWIYEYDPESKMESMQWVKTGENAPRKFKRQRVQTKLMATIFWDAEGILLIDYLPKGSTMNAIYYASLISKVRSIVLEKRRGKLSRGILLLQDNAPCHTAKVSKQAVVDAGFEKIEHPPYSPDLAPSDYYLFPSLKKELCGKKFWSEEEMMSAVNDHFAAKSSDYFLTGLQLLYSRSEKCIAVSGDYIEK